MNNTFISNIINLIKIQKSIKICFFEDLIDKFYKLYCIHLNNKNFINELCNLYYSNNTFTNKNILYNTILPIIIKNNDSEFYKILSLYKNTDDITHKHYLIKSLSYTNNIENFIILLEQYDKLVKTQDYKTFFTNLSKNHKFQKLVIMFCITKYNNSISYERKNFLEIINKISIDVYDDNNIDLLVNFFNNIDKNEHKLIINKIKNIITLNRNIFN